MALEPTAAVTERRVGMDRPCWAGGHNPFRIESGPFALFVTRLERCHERSMIGADAPIRNRQHISFVGDPFAGHARTEHDVINSAIGVLLAVIMRPGDVARFPGRIRAWGVVTVSLGG